MAEFEYQPVDQLKYYPPSDFKDASRLRKHIGDMDPLGRKIVGVSEQIEGGETPDQDFYSENRDVIANYVRDIPKAIQALEEMVEWPDTKFKVEKVGKKRDMYWRRKA